MSKKLFPLFLLGILLFAWAIARFGERWLRLVLIALSHSATARRLISGMPITQRVASRFVAGETMEDAIQAAYNLAQKGMWVTMDFLGEHVSNADEAIAAREEIARLLRRIAQSDLPDVYVSVKLSQLGMRISEELVMENMRQLLAEAQRLDLRIRIDMEESQVTDQTLRIYRALRQEFPNVGVVIQAYLRRSSEDVRQLVAEGAWVRLCKGAYAEPATVAFPDKRDTDAHFVTLAEMMLNEQARANGVYLGVATHDEKMIEAVLSYVRKHQIPAEAFEFQMLYGIRRDLQESLVGQGYRVRVYVPYGAAWYPYFVRRLAERPANLWFFISNFVRR